MKYIGVLHAYFETGCEGLIWVLIEGGKKKFDGMKIIEQGDRLIVYGENGEVLFNGEIDEDREVGWQEYPENPGHGQPCALGYWIHWTQKGWQPDAWAKLFLNENLEGSNGKPLRAELTKKGK